MALLFQLAVIAVALYALYGVVWVLWSVVLGIADWNAKGPPRTPPKLDKFFHVVGIGAIGVLVALIGLVVVVFMTGGGNWGF